MNALRDTDVLILCGGLGKRLRKEIGKSQKVMAKVHGYPFLDHVIRYLKNEGFRRIILCTGYQAKIVEKYYQVHNQGLMIEFSEEKIPLGTGGAVKNARRLIRSNPFFVLNGDSFCSVKFNSFIKFHQSKQAMAAIVISPTKERDDFGSIVLDQSSKIKAFKEKSPTATGHFVNAGIYCFTQDIFSLMPKDKNFSLEYDFFPRLVRKRLFGFKVKTRFMDIGTPQRYKEAKSILGKRKSDGD